MSELFFLNELQRQDVKVKPTYTTDNSNIASVNLFITALNKISDTIDIAVDALSKINHQKISNRSSDDVKLLTTFTENINLASKILDEFQKGTSILHDDTPDFVNLLTELNNTFSTARMKLSLFAITYDLKYTKEVQDIIYNVLKLFEKLKSVVTDTSNSVK